MDPNVALKSIREAISDLKTQDERKVVEDSVLRERRARHVDNEPLLELIENFEALDKWLSTGGFLPADWNKGR